MRCPRVTQVQSFEMRQQLVPAVFPLKQSLIKFSGIDVQRLPLSFPLLSGPRHEWDRRAQLHRGQTYLRADNAAQRKVLCSSESTLSRRISADAPLRWPSYCLNGFQAMMWNISSERGTHSNEDKVIKAPQLSLDLCFFLNYLRRKCASHI